MKQAAFFNRGNIFTPDAVYGAGRRERIEQLTDLYPTVISLDNFAEHVPHLRDLEVIFSTWGMPVLGDDQLDQLPALRAVFYAAGSVQGFARPLLERGITVVSAWAANGIPVAEFTLAQILLATKGYFRNVRDCASADRRKRAFRGAGNYCETVAILGAGQIGRKLIELLRPFNLPVIVYDPFLTEVEAHRLGVEKVSLEAAFARAYVVTNHMPNLPETRGILNGHLFANLRDDATFINTGRGATVAEAELVEVWRQRPSLTALLDVTDPEPPPPGSPLYELPNVHLSGHIAGSIGDEVHRLADFCIEEFIAWQAGRPLRYAVSLEMLETMA